MKTSDSCFDFRFLALRQIVLVCINIQHFLLCAAVIFIFWPLWMCFCADRAGEGGQCVSCISFPLNQQDLSLTGLVVITIISRAIISSHSLQGICESIWFVCLLMRLHQHHLIWQRSGRSCNDRIQHLLVIFHILCTLYEIY